ncbi:cysteine proteinase inhibitor 1-like [Salvia divinorum]|uniref:Cysteine proteinase inhibitor 1-like n=1 Tax=Salvia divinorum TaxID=28513 RepID=A0ABD1GH26_SALDI
MASSMIMTTSFFGGAVAAKPAAATTRRGPLAIRASMDLDKAAGESTNTRRGLVLAGMAAAAASSVVKVAMAGGVNIDPLPFPGWVPVDPNAPDIFQIAVFAVSEHNKQSKSALAVESVIRGEREVVALNYSLLIAARDTKTGLSNNYLAGVSIQAVPTIMKLISFDAILR